MPDPSSRRQCNACGQRLRSSGTRAADGVYFCMARECQAAKARRNRARQKARTPVPKAPTTCVNCGTGLAPRKARPADKFGRWCLASACRRARDAALAKELVDDPTFADLSILRARIEFLWTAVALPRVTCEDCGADDVVEGFRHVTPDGTGCGKPDDKTVKRVDAHHVWPNRVGLPADQLIHSVVERRRIQEIAAASE